MPICFWLAQKAERLRGVRYRDQGRIDRQGSRDGADGLQGPLGRETCTRSVSDQPQAGRSLPACVRNRKRGQKGNCRLPALLEREAPTPSP